MLYPLHLLQVLGGHKKSSEEVKGDLERELIAAAKQLEQDTFGIKSSSNDLEPLLHEISSQQFQRKYGFAYHDDGNQVHPIPTINNPNSVVTISKLCSIGGDVDVDIPTYIDDMILRAANLPSWMNENVRGDLCSTAKHLLAIDTYRRWQFSEYSQTYDAASGDPNQASYQVKSVLVYVNGNLSEDGVSVNMCLLYYMAAYYKVDSQTQTIRQALEQQAYDKVPSGCANDLLSLSNALKLYTAGLYKARFGYDYGGKPKDLPDTTQPYCKFNEHLFYTPGLSSVDCGRLRTMIENDLFAGLNLSIADVKESAVTDMMGQFRSTQTSQAAGSWLQKYIEQIYHPKEAILHPIRAHVIMLHFYGEKVTNKGQKIRVLFIYCMAGFYEVVDTEVLVRQDVLKKLVENLHPPGVVTANPDTLKDLLRDYAKDRFKKEYGFEFQAIDNKPLDQTGDFVQRYSNLCSLTDFNPVTIKDYTEETLFKPGVTGSFPPDIATIIFNSIVERVGRYAEDSQNHDNQWSSETNPLLYPRADPTKKNVKEYCVFVHAIGIGSNASDGGAIVKQGYVYYLSYFCSTAAGNAFDD